jgi:hypothetical protein
VARVRTRRAPEHHFPTPVAVAVAVAVDVAVDDDELVSVDVLVPELVAVPDDVAEPGKGRPANREGNDTDECNTTAAPCNLPSALHKARPSHILELVLVLVLLPVLVLVAVLVAVALLVLVLVLEPVLVLELVLLPELVLEEVWVCVDVAELVEEAEDVAVLVDVEVDVWDTVGVAEGQSCCWFMTSFPMGPSSLDPSFMDSTTQATVGSHTPIKGLTVPLAYVARARGMLEYLPQR